MASGGRAALLRRVALLERQRGEDAPEATNFLALIPQNMPDFEALQRQLMPQKGKKAVWTEAERAMAEGWELSRLSDEALDYLIELMAAMMIHMGADEADVRRLIEE